LQNKKICWLHISDIHIGSSENYDQIRILNDLLNTIDAEKNNDLTPDLIFISGDLVKKGKLEEYEKLEHFLIKLLKITELKRDKIFLIPGNHDVDRELAEYSNVKLEEDQRAVDKFFDPNNSKKRMTVFFKFSNYQKFFNKFYKNIMSFGYGHDHYYAEIREINGLRLAIVGLNSAWLSKDDKDRGRLIIGERIIKEAFLKVKKSEPDIKIIMFHHPISDLVWYDQPYVRDSLHKHFDIILHGHTHDFHVQHIVSHGECFSMAAGATYQGSNFQNNCNYVKINYDRNELMIIPFKWDRNCSELWVKDMTVFPESRTDGIKTFQIKKSIKINKHSKIETSIQSQNNSFSIRAKRDDGKIISNILKYLINNIDIQTEDSNNSKNKVYIITDKTINDLKKEGFPKIIINKLLKEKDKLFTTIQEFNNILNRIFSEEDITHYSRKIIDKSLYKGKNIKLKYLILGDTGAGKTTLSKSLYSKLQSKKKIFLIYLNLSQYFEGSILDLQDSFNSENKSLRELINNKKNIVLIIDSLDKMIPGAIYSEKISKFREIMTISSTCLVTCLFVRTHFFKDIFEENILGFNKLYLMPLSKKTILDFLKKQENLEDIFIEKLANDKKRLLFFNRPLLLNMMIETDPIKFDLLLNTDDIIETYINQWLVRDQLYSKISFDKKKLLLSMIAIETFQNQGKNIYYSELNRIIKIRECEINEDELESFNSDLRTCSFLRRNKNDQYEFMHDIFYEHFIANYTIERMIKKDFELLSIYPIKGNILETLVRKIRLKKNERIISERLHELWFNTDNGTLLNNILDFWYELGTNILELNFQNRTFANLQLHHYDFSDSKLFRTRFHSCYFSLIIKSNEIDECDFIGCNFEHFEIEDICFNNCNFANCYFINSKILKASFINCNFLNINFDKSELDFRISNSTLEDITINCDANINIDTSELLKIWHNQNYDFSNSIYLYNDLIDNKTKYSIYLLSKDKRPLTDIEFDKDFKNHKVSDDSDFIENQKKMKKEIESCENNEEKLIKIFLYGKSKSKQEEFREFREKIKKLGK